MNTRKGLPFLFLLAFIIKANAQNLDIDIAKSINPQQPNSVYWKTTSGTTYAISATIPVWLLTEGLIKKDPMLKTKAIEMFGSVFSELIISESMKDYFHRRRPANAYPEFISPYTTVSGRSFPSGHTSLAFATAASLSMQYKKWYITVPAYAWATTVGYSRVYLGVHYPSDVIVGAGVGIGSAYLSRWLNKKLFHQKDNR